MRDIALLVCLVTLTLAHGVYRLSLATEDPPFSYASEPAPIGHVITELVEARGEAGTRVGTSATRPSDVHAGFCRYVVVGSSQCPFSKRLAVSWTVQALKAEVLLPDDWRAFWIIADELRSDLPSAEEFLDPAFPVPRFSPLRAERFMQDAGVVVFPYHIILNREGVVIGSGRGGVLPAPGDLREDCTVLGPGEEL